MNYKKVSVVTPTYNLLSNGRKCFFYEMFRSVHEQDYPNIEHVIIDGASTDGSVEFIQSMIKKYAKKQVVFVSEKDSGINDASNKGMAKATGDYLILLNDDDFYTRKDAISLLVNQLEKNKADYASADCFWLDQRVWPSDIDSFAYKHPCLLSTLLLKREVVEKIKFLDPKYPMVGDYDLFYRLFSNEQYKGTEINEVVTILRPGGYSSSSSTQHVKETKDIYKKNFGRFFSRKELYYIHSGKAKPFTLLKIFLLIKNKKIRHSVFRCYTKRYVRKYITRRLKYVLFLEFITKHFHRKKPQHEVGTPPTPGYTYRDSRAWIITFYDSLFKD